MCVKGPTGHRHDPHLVHVPDTVIAITVISAVMVLTLCSISSLWISGYHFSSFLKFGEISHLLTSLFLFSLPV